MSAEQETSRHDESLYAPPSRPQQLTRDNLIQRHELDSTDPDVCSLLDGIENLRDTAVVKDFVPIIADKKICDFKKSRQNGNGINPQEPPKP